MNKIEICKKLERTAVKIALFSGEQLQGTGTGVIIKNNGIVLTANHVISDFSKIANPKIIIITKDKNDKILHLEYLPVLYNVSFDANTPESLNPLDIDLAILKPKNPVNFGDNYIRLEDSIAPVGTDVIMVGFPDEVKLPLDVESKFNFDNPEMLEKKEKIPAIKELYYEMQENIERTPLFFYDAQNLRSNAYRIGNRIFSSVTKGEHVRQIMVYQKGPVKYIESKNYINLPAEHIFKGEKMSIDGIFTLAHEYGHFPKKHLRVFAEAYSLNSEQAEELLADILSAKLAVKMGYPKEKVLKHYIGRDIVYGTFPFWQFIRDAVK